MKMEDNGTKKLYKGRNEQNSTKLSINEENKNKWHKMKFYGT